MVETVSAPRLRGTLAGTFWAVTYLGFDLPVLLATIEPIIGIIAPRLVLNGAAATVAVMRAFPGLSVKDAAAHTISNSADANARNF
ncbi:hypothetical protein [Mycolicibacterium sarraceniae]|uniref:Uncharacterized protein n=1 Tax=Mycolicibacterium sarraceniae TaxID=1534348 RepID=A0A7I7SRC4_9MYCO|nr:hypothetical protein [Mycolicibacterium sarraceniae]BBY58346.1 hypothetical protein MSAR_14820 [Mycolicibacterium sarraceniae]